MAGPLRNVRWEKMARLMALENKTIRDAYRAAGYKGNQNAWRVAGDARFRARLDELTHQNAMAAVRKNFDSRSKIYEDMEYVWKWCIMVNPVKQPCPKCHTRFERLNDARQATEIIHLRGLELGMFKKQLDVTSRKEHMIEGTQEQIIDKLAQLLERLGVAALSQLLERLGYEMFASALGLLHYTVEKETDGTVIESIPSGDSGNGRASGKPDPHPVPALPEAACVS